MIRENIAGILGKIAEICHRLGKNPNDITLVGVTKFAGIDQINEAVRCGLTHIGENKVQEAQKKFPLIAPGEAKITRHMIGHMQTNKVKAALDLFDLIQSVDSVKLADVIEKHAAQAGRTIDILLQVNTAGEAQKFGCQPSDVDTIVGHVRALGHVRLQGLMAIAPLTQDKDAVRQCFRDLKNMYDRLGGQPSMRYLSMGMTDDYAIALEEGSNMVRIGRAIFQSA